MRLSGHAPSKPSQIAGIRVGREVQVRVLVMVRRNQMSSGSGTRSGQRGAVLLGIAGGMLVVAGGFVGAYYMTGSRNVANAATTPAEPGASAPAAKPGNDVSALLAKTVELKTTTGSSKLTWAELGATAGT